MRYPQFWVMLDLARDHAGTYTQIAVTYTGDEEDREARMIYEALRVGQYKIEGGYPCAADCGNRHPPLEIARTGSAYGAVETVWRA